MIDLSDEIDITVRCDLHIHSALSPCSEEEMTPGNIVAMSKLIGLDVIAISDHQSCGNCASAIDISEKIKGPLVLPAMEVESSEEIHLLCLFPDLVKATKFEKIVSGTRLRQPNRPEIFGEQYYYDSDDQICGREDQLLLMPSSLSCDELASIAFEIGGACLPAHIDRQANSMLSTLGDIPQSFPGSWLEFSGKADPEVWLTKFLRLNEFRWLKNSDAHRLADILDPGWPLTVPGFSPDQNGREAVIRRLRQGFKQADF